MKIKAALLTCLVTFSTYSFAGSDCYLGEISYFSFNYETRNYTEANGQTLSIRQNEALFSLMDTKYGGDGRTTFNLPKIAPIQTGSDTAIKAYVCTSGYYPSRQ